MEHATLHRQTARMPFNSDLLPLTLPDFQVLTGNAQHLESVAAHFPPQGFDTVVTSPPYSCLRLTADTNGENTHRVDTGTSRCAGREDANPGLLRAPAGSPAADFLSLKN